MSGGHFSYVQYKFDDPIKEIEARILLNHKSHEEAQKMIQKSEDAEDPTLYEILYSVRHYIDCWKTNPLNGSWPEVWDSEEHHFRPATKQEILDHNAEHVFDFDDEEVEIFRQAVQQMRLAAVYLNRIDWFLSGDDGDDSFKKRLAEELAEVRNKNL